MTSASRARSGEEPAAAPLNWSAVLAQLEGEVRAAEETLALEAGAQETGARERAEEDAAWGPRTDGWLPPSNMGAVPADLRERAAWLLQRQLAVAEALVERITQSQRQRDVAARMSFGPVRPVPSYIDRAL